MKRFLSTHLGSLRRKKREPKETKTTPTATDPFSIPRSVSYRKANPCLPEPRKVSSLGSVRRPSHRHHEHESQPAEQSQEAERPLGARREDPPWAIAAGPKLKQKVHSHESDSGQHPALRKGAYQTEPESQPAKKAPPRPPRPEATSSKSPQDTRFKPPQDTSSIGYGQTLDTAKFIQKQNAPTSQVPAESADGERGLASSSDEHNKAIVNKMEDLSWAVEAGLDLTDTVDQDQSIKRLPAVTHEHVRPQVHEVRKERIERHIHNYDIYPQIQPIYDLEILPARHFIEDADGNRVEVAESDLPCCTGDNQRWRVGLEALKHRSAPFAAPAPLNLQRKSEMIMRKERETGAEVLQTTREEYRRGSIGPSYSPAAAEGVPAIQGERFRRGYRPPYEGLQTVPRILRQGRESLLSDNQMEANVAASGTTTFA
ncbi:hypothetical protein PG994_012249 [Apiospora phragmitis]|uniref:Uncharacterized protein n=1 Tax=Apiospora phragmitis TaxID=2905665 RepID=A0ABR1TV40_9PEZI